MLNCDYTAEREHCRLSTVDVWSNGAGQLVTCGRGGAPFFFGETTREPVNGEGHESSLMTAQKDYLN